MFPRIAALKENDAMASPGKGSIEKNTPLQKWLRIHPDQKPKAYAQVYGSAEMTSLSYWLEIVFSAGIAAFGLVLNSPAVIIGAMLISPLMGPIMAMGLALAAGDLYLVIKAIANLLASVSLAIGFSAIIVWLLPFHSITPEILARINPTLLDLGVALFSGLAGSVAVCRFGGGEAVTTLPGVAIAVALMPPLCTIGFGLGSGFNTRIMGGAGLLFLTNLVAIVASAFAVFLLVGMDSPEVRSATEHAREGELFARKLSHSPFARRLIATGQLRWRIVMLAVLLGVIAVPLRSAFVQVAGEAIVRGAVQDVVKGMLRPGDLVSQQVEVGRDSVAVRLVSTRAVGKEKIQDAEREIERRSGRKAEVTVASVASQSELAQLMQRLTTPAQPPPPPPPESLDDIHKQVIARVGPIVSGIWPAEAPLQDFDVAFDQTGIVFNVRYASNRELDKIALDILTKELQEKLGSTNVSLNTKRVRPTRKAAATKPK
ncbi:MAG TPA: DUF389 domain-containing protein [Terracidiphilus sp.]|nr:DUF389 domain-containing protein [Terracidiphilus sp.]HUX28506.1 DUF389 domain-containing protein [Terracidiphilus sp.]